MLSAAGRSPLAPVNLRTQPAALTVLGALAGDGLGAAVALGDLGSDGKKDLVLGAPWQPAAARPAPARRTAWPGGRTCRRPSTWPG